MEASSLIRLFFAVEPSDEVCGLLEHASSIFKEHSISGRFSPRNKYHLTLAYIGTSQRSDLLLPILQEVSVPPFTLTVSGAGEFPGKNGSVLWAGIEPSVPLMNTVSFLRERLQAEGFDLTNRPFSPHITLGRNVKLEESFIEQGKLLIPRTSFTVSRLLLMGTDPHGSGLKYETAFVHELK